MFENVKLILKFLNKKIYFYFLMFLKLKHIKFCKASRFTYIRKFELNFEISNLRKNVEISYIITLY